MSGVRAYGGARGGAGKYSIAGAFRQQATLGFNAGLEDAAKLLEAEAAEFEELARVAGDEVARTRPYLVRTTLLAERNRALDRAEFLRGRAARIRELKK